MCSEFDKYARQVRVHNFYPLAFDIRLLVPLDLSVLTFVFGGDCGRAADDRTSANSKAEEKCGR